jgi:hypothetical protein
MQIVWDGEKEILENFKYDKIISFIDWYRQT